VDAINRAIAIIKPKQPYLDWANSLPDPAENLTLEELRSDCTALMIPEFPHKDEEEAFFKELYSAIFEMELDVWHGDDTLWPGKRDYETFRAWFDVEIHSTVIDVLEKGIMRERYQPL
jgi:hypothetical protein